MAEARSHRYLLDELDALIEQNRTAPTPELAQQLLYLRMLAVHALANEPTTRVATPPEPLPVVGGVPEVHIADLDAVTLAAGLGHHAAIVVRGVLGSAHIRTLTADLEKLIAAQATDKATAYVGGGGNRPTTESPEALAHQLDALADSGLIDVITEYLGARPVAMAERIRLRRSTQGLPWHQDAAFYCGDFASVNVWVALTPCGVDRDGLAVIPRRVDEIVGSLGEKKGFDYGTGLFTPDVIARLSAGEGEAAPTFEPGDALLFDEMTVHRTKVIADAAGERDVAIAWFFSPDRFPQRDSPRPWTKLVV